MSEAELQSDVSLLEAFYDSRLLCLQSHKSSILICSISPTKLELSQQILIKGNEIRTVSQLKYLGIIFDRKLDFSIHAATTACAGRRVLGALRRSFQPIMGTRAFSCLYVAKILPLLTYCISVAAPVHKGAFASLEKVQRLAARFITNDWHSSYKCLLSRLNWKSISRVSFERRALLCFKYIHDLRHQPPGLVRHPTVNCFHQRLRNPPHPLDLCIPHFQRSTIDKVPLLNCLHTWNSLPSAIKSCEILSIFKAAIRNLLNFSTVQTVLPDRLLLIDNL